MLLDFWEGICQSIRSVFLTLRDGNTLHRINTINQTLAFRFREHSREGHLYVLIGSVSQLATMLSSYLLHQVLPIDCSEVANAHSCDPIHDVAMPSIFVPPHRTRLEPPLDGREIDVLDKVHDANPGFNCEAHLVESRHFFILERYDFRLLRVVSHTRETFSALHPLD